MVFILRWGPGAEARIFWVNQVNTLAADALAACVSRTSAAIVLHVSSRSLLSIMHHLLSRKMTENANISSCFLRKILHGNGSIPLTHLYVCICKYGWYVYLAQRSWNSSASLSISNMTCFQLIISSRASVGSHISTTLWYQSAYSLSCTQHSSVYRKTPYEWHSILQTLQDL